MREKERRGGKGSEVGEITDKLAFGLWVAEMCSGEEDRGGGDWKVEASLEFGGLRVFGGAYGFNRGLDRVADSFSW